MPEPHWIKCYKCKHCWFRQLSELPPPSMVDNPLWMIELGMRAHNLCKLRQRELSKDQQILANNAGFTLWTDIKEFKASIRESVIGRTR